MILSDMCPPVSGITTKDAALSVELGMQAVDLAVGGAASAHAGGDTEPNELSDSACGADDNGILQAGGHLLVKLLESEDIQGGINFYVLFYVDNHYCVLQCVSDLHFGSCFVEFSRICKPRFRKVSWLRPKATRSSSREIYLICQGLKL